MLDCLGVLLFTEPAAVSLGDALEASPQRPHMVLPIRYLSVTDFNLDPCNPGAPLRVWSRVEFGQSVRMSPKQPATLGQLTAALQPYAHFTSFIIYFSGLMYINYLLNGSTPQAASHSRSSELSVP
jgi:hypothetical protein